MILDLGVSSPPGEHAGNNIPVRTIPAAMTINFIVTVPEKLFFPALTNYFSLGQFQKSSKILEIHRCDLQAGRFRWLFIQ